MAKSLPPAPPAPVAPVYVPPAAREEAIQRMVDDGDAGPEGTAAMNWPDLFNASDERPVPEKAKDDKAKRVPSTGPYEGRIAVGPIPEDA